MCLAVRFKICEDQQDDIRCVCALDNVLLAISARKVKPRKIDCVLIPCLVFA
jgi:hypothetical protein